MSQDFDVVGDGSDEVGAILQRAGGRPTAPAGRRAVSPQLMVARPGWMGPAGVPQGVTLAQEEMDFLPFDAATLTSTNLTGVLVALPQRPFRGERVVLSAVLQLAAGAVSDAGNAVVIDPAIFVGATQIGATQGSTPLSVFSGGSFGVRLSLPQSGQGTRIVIPIRALIVLAVGDNIRVTGTIIGRAVRLSFPHGTIAMGKLLP